MTAETTEKYLPGAEHLVGREGRRQRCWAGREAVGAGRAGLRVEVREGRGLHTEELPQHNVTPRHSEPASPRLVLQGDTPGEGWELRVGIFYSGNFQLRLCLGVPQVAQLSSKFFSVSPQLLFFLVIELGFC